MTISVNMGNPQIVTRSVYPYNERSVPATSYTLPSKNHLRRDRIPNPILHNNLSENSSSEVEYQGHSHTNANQSHELLSAQHYQLPYEAQTWANSRIQFKSHDPYECMSTYSVPMDADSELGQYSEPMSNMVSDVPPIGGCGGHCTGFEYVCYYVLQIIFVVGILTGISLCIAGVVLRKSNRGSDLGVLVYIGCLWSCVCTVLLGVQCCVRREMRSRKKPLHTHLPLQRVDCRASMMVS